jgi:hypothetical protein
MQPYPLRSDIRRVRNEGDYAKFAPDIRKSVIKMLKYNSIQSYMEKTGLDAPKYIIDPKLLANPSPIRSHSKSPRKNGSPDEPKSPVKKDWKALLKRKL